MTRAAIYARVSSQAQRDRHTIEGLQKHTKDLEERLAPERQTSGLNLDGTQRKEDRDD